MNAGRALTVPDRDSLERDGYLLVPSLMDKTVLARLRNHLGELVRETVAAWEANGTPGKSRVLRTSFTAMAPESAITPPAPLDGRSLQLTASPAAIDTSPQFDVP